VDLMKQREKLQFKNKFNEASRNSIDKHIKRMSEVRKTTKFNQTSVVDAKVLSPKANIKLADKLKSNSTQKAKMTLTDHRKNNSSLGGSISNVMKTYHLKDNAVTSPKKKTILGINTDLKQSTSSLTQ
jgi:predicted ATP-dependent endonuclease of OLD family